MRGVRVRLSIWETHRTDEVRSDIMNSVFRYILLTVLLVNPNTALAQEPIAELTLSGRVQSLVSARYQFTRCPGLSVAVASHNKIMWFDAAYALGDLRAQEAISIPVANLDYNDGVVSLSLSHLPAVGAVIEIETPAVPKLLEALSSGKR
jgi:hypothetical protein